MLEAYKRKKIEKELGESLSGSNSARGSNSSSSGLSRGHSQPPFGRPKSQSNVSIGLRLKNVTKQAKNVTRKILSKILQKK